MKWPVLVFSFFPSFRCLGIRGRWSSFRSAEEGRVLAGPDCSRLGCNMWEISSSLRHGVPDYRKSSKLRTSRWKNQGRKTLDADPKGPKGFVCFPLFSASPIFPFPPACVSTKRMPSMTQGMADTDCHLWSTRVSSCGREGLLWGTEALGLMEARAENWGAIQIKPILREGDILLFLGGCHLWPLMSSRQTCTPYSEFCPSQLWLPCGRALSFHVCSAS